MKKIFLFFLLITNFIKSEDLHKELYFCTAADTKYYDLLLNLIGSIHETNYENLKEIAVFNIGMTKEQIENLKRINKVSVYEIEKVNPYITDQFRTNNEGKIITGWYSWKPVAIKQAVEMFPYVLWIDAGLTVLKPIDDLFKFIQINKYFLCSIHVHNVDYQTTKYLKNKFELDKPENNWILLQSIIPSGIIGITKDIYRELVLPFYELSKDIKNFEDDGSTSKGFGTGRHDQSVLTLLAYKKKLNVIKDNLSGTINLNINGKDIPFHIAWWYGQMNDQIQIYCASKNDEKYKNKFIKSISYQK